MEQPFFQIDKRILALSEQIEEQIAPQLKHIDGIAQYNTCKVQRAFADQRVSESHFAGTSGYGYDDRGRETLERVFAQVVGAQDSLYRHNFVSGTAALTCALFGVLRPGDRMVCLTGTPYDTLHGVIGLLPEHAGRGTLKDFGIQYEQIELKDDQIDLGAVSGAVAGAKIAYIQRSRGYSLRRSLSCEDVRLAAAAVKAADPQVLVVVDNCYGEFVDTLEPTEVGADLIVGSLIKNPGGGIAQTGGYIAGREDLVELCACRLTSPSTGKEVGCTLGQLRSMYMGLFFAPTVVAGAVKTATFAAALFEAAGYRVSPRWDERRADIIQTIVLGSGERVSAFCRGVQQGAPVDSFVTPEAWDMPGYDDPVIMAAGAFNMGASIELSADAPMREPYACWLQGGLTWPSGKLGVLLAAQSMLEAGVLFGKK
ncbi:aminotransferase class I/II-fold pyridoxal phosphate-dependent enzyme [Provencibacterium massiliense]|uniref:methionine gamma-lyase family protein n=1 Tax=Provencibacterium massiliense TaxID=1841868 RepID=UPI0009A73F24|nr:methionine gamma-lyase family protein [Provencibacterium massiliense]